MNYFYYSRISTVGQNVSRQLETFKKHGHVNSDNVFIDKVQGNIPFMERENASKLFDKVTSSTEPTTIVIDSIDRLGRSLSDILNTIDTFTNNGINIESIKEGFSTLLMDGTKNPIATLLVGIMGSISEMERTKIKERTAEGIQIAKANGKFKGRKIGSTQSDETMLKKHLIIVGKLKKGLSIRDTAEITGKSTTTVNTVRKLLIKRGELV